MVNVVDGRANLKLVDFDWAGRARKVRYPLLRNASINWPGKSGGRIKPGHDRKMVDSCQWPNFR